LRYERLLGEKITLQIVATDIVVFGYGQLTSRIIEELLKKNYSIIQHFTHNSTTLYNIYQTIQNIKHFLQTSTQFYTTLHNYTEFYKLFKIQEDEITTHK
jgi:hypothetical protein